MFFSGMSPFGADWSISRCGVIQIFSGINRYISVIYIISLILFTFCSHSTKHFMDDSLTNNWL